MPGLRKIPTSFFTVLLLAVIIQSAFASDFTIHSVRSELDDDVYLLSARLDIDLGKEMREALKNGVPLVFVLDLHVKEKKYRWYRKSVVKLEQRYELRYHALSQLYILTNLNTGIQTSFRSLSRSLDSLGKIESLPLLDASVIADRDNVSALLRLRLDVSELPLPLKVRAYTNDDWQTRSRWTRWDLP